MAPDPRVRGHREVFRGDAEPFAGTRREQLNDVRARVVPGVPVLATGIPQTYDQEVADGSGMLLTPEQGR